ncbi:hypothetical protein EDD11_008077 [Mortierella claussenii]|nr:hypothetical protein EDD11_008077 [Mortierella claussenii]
MSLPHVAHPAVASPAKDKEIKSASVLDAMAPIPSLNTPPSRVMDPTGAVLELPAANVTTTSDRVVGTGAAVLETAGNSDAQQTSDALTRASTVVIAGAAPPAAEQMSTFPPAKTREKETDDSAALPDESAEIASDIQERSQFSDADSITSEEKDENEPRLDDPHRSNIAATEDAAAQGPIETASGTLLPDSSLINAPPILSAQEHEDAATLTVAKTPGLTMPNIDAASASTQARLPGVMLPDIDKEESQEPAASYTSPNHEWARILQKRLGKGLSDAQLLARSNSMLASPSILAQSLVQVIPSLQVKDTSAASLGSAGREYQTAEELFDRPAAIAPSASAFHYDDQLSKEDAFPSSALANSAQSQLLLFAPLNPDQLGKPSSFLQQPTAPQPTENLSLIKQPQPTPVPVPAPSQMHVPQPQPSTLLVPQPGHLGQPSIPIPIPPIASASSPVSRTHVISPPNNETRQSPIVTRDPGTGARNQRHSVMQTVSGQDERPTLNSHGTSNSRTLLAQGSSSSLTATPISGILRDPLSNCASNYPAPIQYTPVTQYKANPAKEGSRPNKKVRDIPASSKEPAIIAEPVQEARSAIESKEPAVATGSGTAAETPPGESSMPSNLEAPTSAAASAAAPAATPAADTSAQWALEALSGLSDVDFDATLPVSLTVTTTLANSSQSKEAPTKPPMAIPPISSGSRNNLSVGESSPKAAKVIQSPFESTQITTEDACLRPRISTPELKSQPIQWAATNTDPNQSLTTAALPTSALKPLLTQPATTLSSPSYSGAHPTAPSNQMAFVAAEKNSGTVGHRQGSHGTHQATRSVSSLRDFQLHGHPPGRDSQEFSHSRKGEMSASADFAQPSISQAPPIFTPSPFSLGSGYQVPWLPQSQPFLPPRADVNSIDVPALTGKQQLPLNPRPLDLDLSDPCLQFRHIGEALRHWGVSTPEGNAFANLDGKGVETRSWDWSFTLGRAEMIARAIHDKTQLRSGARVALVFRLSEIMEFIAAFYGSILAGVVPVLVNQIQDFSEMIYIMTSAKVELALTTQINHKSLQRDLRKGAAWPAGIVWWQTDILETWAPKNNQQERLPLSDNEVAYIEFTRSSSGELKGVTVSHKNLIGQCQTLYSSFNWRPALFRDKNGNMQTDPLLATDSLVFQPKDRKKKVIVMRSPGTVMTWLEPRQQSGLIVGLIMGVFCGNFTVFMESTITAVSGLWAHSVAAYRANIAFADHIGMQRLLHNFRVHPQATVTPTRPDLRFLHTMYVDTQSNDSVLHREFLDDFLYPLGMIARHDSHPNSDAGAEEQKSPSKDRSENVRSDLGLVAFLSLPEHGGMIVCLRDTLGAPAGAEQIDLRKQYRKSTLPRLRRASESVVNDVHLTGANDLRSVEHGLQPSGSDHALKGNPADPSAPSGLAGHPVSSMTCGEYLLHRGALRSNRIAILSTGDEAYRRRDEQGAVLVSAFGYPLAQSTVLVVDPETLALSLPDAVGELWVSSPSMPAGFWGLPEHTQEVFNARPYIVTEDNMIPTIYHPPGCERMLRTSLLGAIIEGRVVVFGSYWDRLQQDMADPLKPVAAQYEYHHCSDLKRTLLSKVGGIGEMSIFECYVNKEYLPVVCLELSRGSRSGGQSINTVAQHVAINARYAIQNINALRSYCLAVWDINALPRMFENGRRVIDHALCKKMFELGRIYKMLYFATFTDDVLFNIPRGDDPVDGFWSRECCVRRQRRQGAPLRYVQYTSNITNPDAFDEKANVFMGKFHSITDVLIWRTIIQPEDVAFVELDSKGKEQKVIPFKKFNHRVTACAMLLDKKHGLKAGDHVILWFAQELDYIITIHACWVLGVIPIPLSLPDSGQVLHQHTVAHSSFTGGHAGSGSLAGLGSGVNLPLGANVGATISGTNSSILALSPKAIEDRRSSILRALLRATDEFKVKAVLGNNVTDDFLKQKSTGTHLRACRATFTTQSQQTPEMFSSPDIVLPPFCNVNKATKTKQLLGAISGYAPRKEWFGPNYPAVYLIDPEAKAGAVASNKFVKLNHETLNNLCRNQKLQFKMLSGQSILPVMSIFHGLGFVHGCLSGIYNGGPTVILQPIDFCSNPLVWLEAVTRYKAQDVALTYPLLDQVLSRLDGTHGPPTLGSVTLECVKNFMICGHERVQRDKNMTAMMRLGSFKLESEAVNLVYSHPLNPMVTSQVERDAGPIRLHVSSRNLRYGLVTPTSEGDDPTGIWLEDVGVSTVCTSIAIVHPETLEVCAANQIGEIWICSDSSANSFHVAPGMTINASQPQSFNANITGYDSRVRYVRTGDVGFLWNSQEQKLLLRQHSLSKQGSWNATQASHAGSGSFHLFVLGRMNASFQMYGLLHFSADIEATVESSHANVAVQGCVAFKTAQAQVVCVVKVENQEPEVLVSMYIPLMHAILEQHQFLPDTIVLVGDSVSTARRLSDGLKPRESTCSLYSSERLPILHLHHCHGKPLPPVASTLLPPINEGTLSESPTTTVSGPTRAAHPYAQQLHQPSIAVQQPPSMMQQHTTAGTGASRFLNGVPAGTSNSYNNGGSNRNSLYGSPLLVANVPLPPGAPNPLSGHSPVANSPTSIAYQPHTQYHPAGYNSATVAGNASLPSSAGSANHPNMAASLPSAPLTVAGIPSRPMSQQGYTTNSPYTGVSAAGSGSGPGSGSSSAALAQSLYNELAMYSNSPANSSGSDRSRAQHRHTQQPLQQHSSQPHLVHQARPVHPRQLRSQEGRSLSSEELRLDGKGAGSGGAVKSIMKGMNAKWSEIRKAGMN